MLAPFLCPMLVAFFYSKLWPVRCWDWRDYIRYLLTHPLFNPVSRIHSELLQVTSDGSSNGSAFHMEMRNGDRCLTYL